MKKVISLLFVAVLGWGILSWSMAKKGTNAPEFAEDALGKIQIDITKSEQQWLAQHKKIKVGVIRDMPPYESYNATLRRPEGIVAGYWTVLEDSLNMQFRAVMLDSWDEGAKLLQKGKIDALSFISVERAKRFNLLPSDPYIASSLGIFTNNYGAFINTLDDVFPQAIAIDNITAVHRMVIGDKRYDYRVYPSAEVALKTVRAGKERFYVGDILRTKYMIEKHSLNNMRYIAPVVGSSYGFAWAVEPKNRVFVQLVNKVLAQISPEQGLYLRYKWVSKEAQDRSFWAHRYARYFMWLSVGFVLALIGIIYRSRTLRKRVMQISQSQKMESLGRLAGGVAHDFNNMLAGIQGAAEFMKMKASASEQKKFGKYVDIIINACRRAAHLTSQLLVFSREKELRFEALNFNSLLEDSILLLEHGVSKKMEIMVRTKAKDCCVNANRDLIQNMILNLGFNSRDAMENGGKLLFATRNVVIEPEDVHNFLVKVKPGRYLELTVKDNGIGIAPENLGKIFEPFYTTKALGKGTGLGLAAVYGIVVEHKGTIKVDSSTKGTTFKIYFPLHDGEICVEKETPMPKSIKAKILAVDDEKILLELLKDILKSLDCEVVAFDNPQVAAEYYEKHNDFDVVMLDVLMPHLSGVELFYKLRECNPKVKAIFMSGYSKDTEVEKIVAENANTAFIKKPYNMTDLGEKLRALL